MMDLTVMIAARNAESTIRRALESVKAAGNWPVLLINDYSEDNTVAIAKEYYGDNLQIIQPKERKNIGTVRAAGLKAVDTPYAMWLDADDEILPGRIEAMMKPLLLNEADFVYGDCILIDGTTGKKIKQLSIPGFLKLDGAYCRQFERNWIPSIGWPAFNTNFAKTINYDTALLHGEDYDILIRAIAQGAKVRFSENSGHKYYDYPTSLSRNLDRSRGYLPQILQKHSYESVAEILRMGNVLGLDNLFCLVSNAVFQKDYDSALNFLGQIVQQPDANIETSPYDASVAWKTAFYIGTTELLSGNPEAAVPPLRRAISLDERAEALNNLSVAYSQTGKHDCSRDCLLRALALNSTFFDALRNQESEQPAFITTHPFRLQNARDNYTMDKN